MLFPLTTPRCPKAEMRGVFLQHSEPISKDTATADQFYGSYTFFLWTTTFEDLYIITPKGSSPLLDKKGLVINNSR